MNESGIHPVEYKCLIKMPPAQEKTKEGFRKSASGIIYQCKEEEREEKGREQGVFIEAGGLAFTDPDWPSFPKPGDTVLFDRYAGSEQTGKDGAIYRLVNDKELGAIMEVD